MRHLDQRADSAPFLISAIGIALSLHLPGPSVGAKVPSEDQNRDSPLLRTPQGQGGNRWLSTSLRLVVALSVPPRHQPPSPPLPSPPSPTPPARSRPPSLP